MKHLFFLIIAFRGLLFAEEPRLLQFSDFPEEALERSHPLWRLQGQRVQIRGFWYSLAPTQGILAASPQLKSCCVGNPSKIYQQLRVRGNIAPSYYHGAITLEGIFKIQPLTGAEGQVVQYYRLEEAREIETRSNSSLPFIFVFTGGVLGCLIWFKRKAKSIHFSD